MNVAEVVALALQSLSLLASNPKLGGGGLKKEEISELLEQFAILVRGGQKTWEELKEFAREVRDLADRGAQPSPRQWDLFRSRDEAVRATLQAAKERLTSEGGEGNPEREEGGSEVRSSGETTPEAPGESGSSEENPET